MSPEGTFNWPDGDVILRATHRTDIRDFRVHKLLLSLTSPVFKDMFQLPKSSSSAATSSSIVDIIDMADPPRAVEVILRLIYPSTDSPAVKDLSHLLEVLAIAEKYDIEVARSRFRRSLVEFAETEPLRVYAIAYRLGYEDEKKVASSCSTSVHLPGLVELPEELKFIPAMEYHRLILLHARYRKEVEAIAKATDAIPLEYPASPAFNFGRAVVLQTIPQQRDDRGPRQKLIDSIKKGTPLNYESLMRAVRKESGGDAIERGPLGNLIHYVLDKANALNLTV